MAGTIDVSDRQMFQKLIFRVSRGKVLVHFDPHHFKIINFDGQEKERAVYILVF